MHKARMAARPSARRGAAGPFQRNGIMADVKFGLVLDVNGHEVVLEPKTAINKIQDEPIELELPPGTEIRMNIAGGLKAFINEMSTTFGGGKVTWPENLPEPLQTTINYLETLDITINEFWIRIAAKEVTDKDGKKGRKFVVPEDYRIGVYVSGATIGLFGSLAFKGFIVQIAAGNGIKKA
jgi:hypothetical protein